MTSQEQSFILSRWALCVIIGVALLIVVGALAGCARPVTLLERMQRATFPGSPRNSVCEVTDVTETTLVLRCSPGDVRWSCPASGPCSETL